MRNVLIYSTTIKAKMTRTQAPPSLLPPSPPPPRPHTHTHATRARAHTHLHTRAGGAAEARRKGGVRI